MPLQRVSVKSKRNSAYFEPTVQHFGQYTTRIPLRILKGRFFEEDDGNDVFEWISYNTNYNKQSEDCVLL